MTYQRSPQVHLGKDELSGRVQSGKPYCAEWLVTQSARVLFSCFKSQREEATQLTAPDLSLETVKHELQTGGSPGKSELFWKEQSRKAASAVGLVEGTVTLVLRGESQRMCDPGPWWMSSAGRARSPSNSRHCFSLPPPILKCRSSFLAL